MSDLGLNTVHEEEVRKFLNFARYNRNQQLRSVEGSFQDLKDSRLHEDTFTVDEVEEMLSGLQSVVKSSVELELLNAAHTNVLILVQLFGQAEKWHLKLQSDISELENQKLLKEIADFEEQEISGVKTKKMDSGMLTTKKLEPLNEGGSTALLQMEINRLNEENNVLKNKIRTLEKSTTKLHSDLDDAKKILTVKPTQLLSSKPSDEEINLLSDKVLTLSANLKEAENQYQRKCSSMEEELANTKHYVLALQHELETLNLEFDKKFSETTQFKNLKKMLEGKNTQIKDLRSRLKQFEPDLEL